MILPWIYQCFSNVFPMIFPCFSDVFPMFFSHDFSMIFQCFCYVFPIEQTAVVCGGGAFRVSCGALDHGAGPEKPTIKVTWSPKRWEWTSVYSTVYNIILYIYRYCVFSFLLEIAIVFWVEGGDPLCQGELEEGPAVASPSTCVRWEQMATPPGEQGSKCVEL